LHSAVSRICNPQGELVSSAARTGGGSAECNSAILQIENLRYVSWCRGANWLTASYDHQALSAGMRKIFDLIGDRQAKQGETL
jgi:hypothetical protein